ncbi:hypothetical protein IX332_001582 [Porphyromonas levii]|uniref:DUF5606 domain-containing protein n=2 Tax=Porphyromonas levii TaxID=28114 RepID=A0A4Y8WPM0_9PORP|nr:hypothetical protein [Porphyromonas levii]MBR8714019.1 hypothetical protein [Porphyromonas levii]MBR8716027.1 hypothetical protein [Porphyromonas levii]MBR8728556.1 hypothetical protein [Porphyromonas levii]MBR8730242.1 hypothetical protein [Porphyromonas levii]
MKLTDVISISGKPGLFKLINRTRAPFTAEDLESGRKQPLFARDNIVSLADISIYTEEGDKPLAEVFEEIKAKYPEIVADEAAIIADKTKLRGWMAEVLPIYDKERVHDSDIKKLVKWYNILRKAGMEAFVVQEDDQTTAQE